jgi:hypothetical protein
MEGKEDIAMYIGLALELRVVLGFRKDCSVLQLWQMMQPEANKYQGLTL